MLTENDMYISPKYSRRYYTELNLKLNSPQKDWHEAIAVLKDRIYGRYLDPIQELLDNNPNKNGFASMALICLLIDTLMQFRFGLSKSKKEESGRNYVNFMKEYLHIVKEDSEKFYVDIRCGILHSAETKNGSFLDPDSNENTKAIKSFPISREKTILIVNFKSMNIKLKDYFNSYCEELKDCNNTECRKNFIKKMDDITMKPDKLADDNVLWGAICKKAGRDLLDYTGFRFSYSVKEHEQSLVIKREGIQDEIHIHFSEIKRFLLEPQKRFSFNNWFIESILKEFPAVVNRYIQDNVA